jgi:hypothetical protein
VGEHRLGEHLLVTTAARDELANLRRRYVDLGEKLRTDFRRRFVTIGSADELFASYPNEIRLAVSRMVSYAATDLAAQKIYHWDEPALQRKLEERAEPLLEKFEIIREQYLSIVLTAEERENLREGAGQSRPGLIGGGFGVEGAVKGIAVATAANAAIGLVYGAANAVGKALATAGDAQRKKELFQAPTTSDGLADVLRDIAIEGHRLVADLVNSERQEALFDVVTDAATQRASALTANVAAGRVPSDETAAVLIEALQLNPFADRAWELWVERIGDQDGSVARAAEALGVTGLVHYKQSVLERGRAELAWSTPEECESSGDLLEAQARFLGLPFNSLRKEIRAKSVALDELRRTLNEKLYATIEEMEADRVKLAEISRRTVAGVLYETETAADDERDIQKRTFNGRLYASLERVKSARKEKLRSVSIFYWLAIAIAPFPSAFISIRRGFSSRQRFFSFIWMVIYSTVAGIPSIPNGTVNIVGLLATTVVSTIIFMICAALAEGVEIVLRLKFSDRMNESDAEREERLAGYNWQKKDKDFRLSLVGVAVICLIFSVPFTGVFLPIFIITVIVALIFQAVTVSKYRKIYKSNQKSSLGLVAPER